MRTDSGATLLGVRTQQDDAVEVMATAARKTDA